MQFDFMRSLHVHVIAFLTVATCVANYYLCVIAVTCMIDAAPVITFTCVMLESCMLCTIPDV